MTQPKQEDTKETATVQADITPALPEQVFMYPGDAKTPSISVRATSQEKADELYKAKVKEIKS